MLARVVTGGLYFPDGESGPYTADRIQTNSAANIWAAEQWKDYLAKYGKPVPDKKDSRELFWNGNVAFNFDGPWFIGMSASKDKAVVDDIGLMPQPDVVYDGTTYNTPTRRCTRWWRCSARAASTRKKHGISSPGWPATRPRRSSPSAA